MNFLKNFIIIFILFLMSCSSPPTKKTEITFAEYIKTLNVVPLPFEHACSGPNFSKYSVHFDSTGFKKYGDRDCARPLGILFNNTNYIVIVDLSLADYCIAPCLTSFNKKGGKIDSLDLYGHSYIDTASSSMPYFMINKEKHIIVIDTIKTWNNDDSGGKTSQQTKIDSTIYFLSKNGKFIRVLGRKL